MSIELDVSDTFDGSKGTVGATPSLMGSNPNLRVAVKSIKKGLNTGSERASGFGTIKAVMPQGGSKGPK